MPYTFTSVMDFGAPNTVGVGDAVADTFAIQTGINETEGPLIFPPAPFGRYLVNSRMHIGDGNATTVSPKHNIQLIGCGGRANMTTPIPGGTIIEYVGPWDPDGTLFEIRGPIYGVSMKNMLINCGPTQDNKIGYGVVAKHLIRGKIEELNVINFVRAGIVADSYPAGPASLGNNQNEYRQLFLESGAHGATGFIMGPSDCGTQQDIRDACQNIVTGLYTRLYAAPGTGTVGIRIRFSDMVQWSSILTAADKGILLEPPTGFNGHIWPAGHHFDSVSVIGGVHAAPGWAGGGISLLRYAHGDGEPIPNIPGVWGVTNTGKKFGIQD